MARLKSDNAVVVHQCWYYLVVILPSTLLQKENGLKSGWPGIWSITRLQLIGRHSVWTSFHETFAYERAATRDTFIQEKGNEYY
jgi:hypothetical protein